MLIIQLQRAFGDRISEVGSQLHQDTAPGVKENAVKVENALDESSYFNHDYTLLYKRYGRLEDLSGGTISLTLHDAAVLLERRRVKLDSFTALQKSLKADFNITLKITSRRGQI